MLTNNCFDRRRSALRSSIVTLILGWVAAVASPAMAVDLDLGSGAGRVGDIVNVPVSTTDVTGQGVYSFELEIHWFQGLASLVGVETTGTVGEGIDVAFSSGPGTATVVGSASSPLAGAGTLLELEFELGPTAANGALFFDGAILNEGVPAVGTLGNGQLQVSGLPTINVTPTSAELLVGDSVSLSASGATGPYTFRSSDPSIADFTGETGELVGLVPGAVDVEVEEAEGFTRTVGPYMVRAIGLTAGDVGGAPGDTVRVPLTITDPEPYDLVSVDFDLGWPAGLGRVVGVDLVGTVAESAGWTNASWSSSETSASLALAGTTALDAPGILLFVEFAIDPDRSTSSANVTPVGAVFNEVFPAIEVAGQLSVVRPPEVSVSPNAAGLVAGDVQTFTVSGPVTPPVTWSVSDPTVASIDAGGVLTALAEGTTQVRFEDAVGATDTSAEVRVCALRVQIPDVEVGAGVTTRVPITVDREIDALSIYSYEIVVEFDETRLQVTGVSTPGTATVPWTEPTLNLSTAGRARIVAAGSALLIGEGPLLELLVEADPAFIGEVHELTLQSVLFNEGAPCSYDVDGSATIVEAATGASPQAGLLRLRQNQPNPFNPRTSITFGVVEAGAVALRVYDTRGRVVRTIVDEILAATGEFTVRWDGTDDSGRRVPSGVYHYRLESGGERISRKMILLK